MAKGLVTDEHGVEMTIEHNQGMLQEVRFPERAKRNGSVRIVVPGLQHPQLPSFDTRDRQLVEDLEVLSDKLKTAKAEAMKKAVAEGKDEPDPVEVWVAYRAHVVRDQKVDDKVPWAEVPSDAEHRHKRLIAIAEDQTDAAQAMLAQAEFECKAKRLGAQRSSQPVANQPNPPPEPMRTGGSQADTYAFTAAAGMVTWAFEVYQKADVQFYGRHVRTLAARLLAISDDLQTRLTGQPVNRNANSHVRVRGILHTVIDRHPVPVDSDEADRWEQWEADVRKTATSLVDIAKQLHDEHRATA